MFGNSLQGEAMLKAMLLPKLVSMNSLNFDFIECSFSDKLMDCKDKKDGLSREGCGRVSIMRACNGLPCCYTLECNYASGRAINHLAPKVNSQTGAVEPETPITDEKSKIYSDCLIKNPNGAKKQNAPPYTIEIFEDIGWAFCIGLLDFYEINPISRIPQSNLKTIEGVKQALLAQYPIFLPKKKEEEKEQVKPLRKTQTQSLQRNQTQRNNLSANGRVIIGSRGATGGQKQPVIDLSKAESSNGQTSTSDMVPVGAKSFKDNITMTTSSTNKTQKHELTKSQSMNSRNN